MKRILAIAAVLVAAGVVLVLGTAADDGDQGGYKVRAIFDNAFSLIKGEDVRVAGVTVGRIDSLAVTDDNKAAVVLDIKKAGFDDFRKDARCTIRPQSLIGERFVECTLTEPRTDGSQPPPPLGVIPDGQDGAGQHLLPVDRTTKPVDTDLINNVQRLPERQRLAIILNELGAAVGGRSQDLNATIRRANPALGAVNRVLKIIGSQNQVLRELAKNSDTNLAPLARERAKVADFITQANTVSRATAERRVDFERNLQLLPQFLAQLKPTMVRLGSFSDQFRPLLSDLRAGAPAINRMIQAQGPFAKASIPAIESLGETADVGGPALSASKPIIDDLKALTDEAAPVAKDLGDLLVSFRDTGGIERLFDYIFYQGGAINGYDQFGHYLRAGLVVNTCTTYATSPAPGCSARFTEQPSAAARAATLDPSNILAAMRAANPGAEEQTRKLSEQSGSAKKGSAASQRAATQERSEKPIKLPPVLLPGQDDVQPDKGSGEPAATDQSSAEGLLDYLLGGGS